jgi:phosphoglycolate phosphatase-like HAD superfamily hydrolase
VVDDILAAKAARKKVPIVAIGFLSSHQGRALKVSLYKAGADLVIENPKEFLQFINDIK